VLINPINYFFPLFSTIRTYKYFQSKDFNIEKIWKFPFKRNLFILEANCVFWSDWTFYKNPKKFNFGNSLGKYLLLFKKKVLLSFFLSFQRLAILLVAPKNWFWKKVVRFIQQNRGVFFLSYLAIFQQLFTPEL
jgi:hypothetical protein